MPHGDGPSRHCRGCCVEMRSYPYICNYWREILPENRSKDLKWFLRAWKIWPESKQCLVQLSLPWRKMQMIVNQIECVCSRKTGRTSSRKGHSASSQDLRWELSREQITQYNLPSFRGLCSDSSEPHITPSLDPPRLPVLR